MKLVHIMQVVFNQVGFLSFKDFILASVYCKDNAGSIYAVSLPAAAIITTLSELTNAYIYTPAVGIVILWAATIIDTLLGLSVAVSKKEGIQPNRIGRAFVRAFVQTVFVAIFFNMNLAWDYIIMSWMVDSLLLVFTLTVFYSAIRNAHTLDLVTDEQYSFIEGLVNVKKLLDKFKHRKNEGNT